MSGDALGCLTDIVMGFENTISKIKPRMLCILYWEGIVQVIASKTGGWVNATTLSTHW